MVELKSFWNRIRNQVKKAKTWVKTLGMMLLGGGLSSVLAVYVSGTYITFDHDGLVRLGSAFGSGCLIALIGYWTHSPLFAPREPGQPSGPSA